MTIARVAALAALLGFISLGVVVPAEPAAPTSRPGAKPQAPPKAAVRSSKVPARIPAPAVVADTLARPTLGPAHSVPAAPAMTRTANGRPNRTAGPGLRSMPNPGTREGVQPNPVERPVVPVSMRQVPVRQVPVRQAPRPVH
jgi:hypothetical protein